MRALAVILLCAGAIFRLSAQPRPPHFDRTQAVRVNPPIVATGSIPGIAAIVNREYSLGPGALFWEPFRALDLIADIRMPVSRVDCWLMRQGQGRQQDTPELDALDTYRFLPGTDSIRHVRSQYGARSTLHLDTPLPVAQWERYRRLRNGQPPLPEPDRTCGDTLVYLYPHNGAAHRILLAADRLTATEWFVSEPDTLIDVYQWSADGLLKRHTRTTADGSVLWTKQVRFNKLHLLTRMETSAPASGQEPSVENWAYHYYVTPNHHFVIEKSRLEDDRHILVERYSFDERFHWIAVENLLYHYQLLRRLEY